MLLAILLREAVLMSNIEHQFEHKWKYQVCSILGAFNLYTALLVVILVASSIAYLLRRVDYKKSSSAALSKEFELGFVVLTFLVPSVGLLYTDVFGLSIACCWLR